MRLEKHKHGNVIRILLAVVIAPVFFSAFASKAQTVFFFDNFTETTLNPLWQASLPNAPLGSFPHGASSPDTAVYNGAPGYSFQMLSNVPVLRMTNFMGPDVRHGWVLNTNIITDNFRYEVRFNSVNQSSTTSIDAFLEIWLLDPSNPANYDIVEAYGGNFGSDFYAFADSGVDGGSNTKGSYSNQNCTWYRLVLEGESGSNIRASLRDDNENELFGTTFGHGASAYSSGFNIVLSQAIGGSDVPYPDDVAVNYVLVTTADAPPTVTEQPQSQATALSSNVTINVTAAGDGPLSYQWYFKGQTLAGQTDSTLTLTNLQYSNAGNYCVSVANAFGTNVSANAYISITNQPPLYVQTGANTMVLYWSTSTPSVLETTTNLNSTNWFPLTPVTIGAENIYPASFVDPCRFFPPALHSAMI